MSVVEKITKTIDEVLFRRLLLDELRQLFGKLGEQLIFPFCVLCCHNGK